MKKSQNSFACKTMATLFLLTIINVYAWAQDKSVATSQTTTTSTEQHNWYTEPWVWIVAGAVFLLLLVALIRGGSSSSSGATTDRVTYTKTTETDANA